MQTTLILVAICEEMERTTRSFLWGIPLSRKGIHVVKWVMVCQPKVKGGLGLRYLKESNIVLWKMAGD